MKLRIIETINQNVEIDKSTTVLQIQPFGSQSTGVLRSTIEAAGDLIIGTGAAAVDNLPRGPHGYYLMSDDDAANKLSYNSPSFTSENTTEGTAGETLAQGDAVYRKWDNKWYKIDTDASTPACGYPRGIVSEASGITAGNAGTITIVGEVTGFSDLTIGEFVYASTTAGGVTQTRPTLTSGSQIATVILGIANSATSVLALPTSPVIYGLRQSTASSGSAIVKHHHDKHHQQRELCAWLNTTSASAIVTTSGSVTVDTGYLLESDATVYGADVFTGGTASATSYYSSDPNYAPSKAFDDNDATAWYSDDAPTSGSAQYLRYDLGSGVSKTIERYRIKAAAEATADLRAFPKTFVLQGSNNGSDWTNLDTQSSLADPGNGTWTSYIDFTGAVYRYYQLNITDRYGTSNYVAIAELEGMELVGDGTEYSKLAQSFQVTAGYSIDKIKLWLSKTGSPTGTLTARIETDTGGEPSGTLVNTAATATAAESGLSTSYGWIEFDFSSNFWIDANTTYWIVLSTDREVSDTNYILWGVDNGEGYTSGEFQAYTNDAWSSESRDAAFEVYSETTFYREPVDVGSWTIAESKVCARGDNGAGGNIQTNTTFKNADTSTRDLTFEVRLP